jgi:hypothetical protein
MAEGAGELVVGVEHHGALISSAAEQGATCEAALLRYKLVTLNAARRKPAHKTRAELDLGSILAQAHWCAAA